MEVEEGRRVHTQTALLDLNDEGYVLLMVVISCVRRRAVNEELRVKGCVRSILSLTSAELKAVRKRGQIEVSATNTQSRVALLRFLESQSVRKKGV